MDRVVLAALATDPAQRYPSAAAFRDALRRVVHGPAEAALTRTLPLIAPIPARRAAARAVTQPSWRQRPRWGRAPLALAGAALLAGAVITATFAGWSPWADRVAAQSATPVGTTPGDEATPEPTAAAEPGVVPEPTVARVPAPPAPPVIAPAGRSTGGQANREAGQVARKDQEEARKKEEEATKKQEEATKKTAEQARKQAEEERKKAEDKPE